ncbi:MAG: hypothetical protein AB1405_18250 [Bdellovibrionota bacterium]
MTQVPQMTQISGKNDDRLEYVEGPSGGWTPLDSAGQIPEKDMIALSFFLRQMVNEKNFGHVATWVFLVVLIGFTGFPGGLGKVAMLSSMTLSPVQIPRYPR